MTEGLVEASQDVDIGIMSCPITKQALVYRSPSLLETVDGSYRYPIKDGIFFLTADSAIGHAINLEAGAPVRPEKEVVRNFYNDFGWKLTETGIYKDTEVWVDRRTRSSEFSTWCARRVGGYLPRSGTYLLDAGSGAIPHSVYMEYHANYRRRICVDFSIAALQEARRKLGDRGIYVLGDVTNLPFRDDAIDAVISNHVLYHVPADEQAKAFREFWRVTRPGGRAVVVYAWKAPWLAKWITRFSVRVLRLTQTKEELARNKEVVPDLYYYPHCMRWFRRQNWAFKYRIRIFRVVSEEFMLLYLSDNMRSKFLILLLKTMQYAFPAWCGRYGQHPAIIIFK
ncbi:MAG: class I SAM-dependent methyltransferase [Stellaceae bacterium]